MRAPQTVCLIASSSDGTAFYRIRILGKACPDIAEGARVLGEGEYLIYYRVAGGDIVILRVLHGQRSISGEDVAS